MIDYIYIWQVVRFLSQLSASLNFVVPWLEINGTSKGKLKITADLCLCLSVWQNLNLGVQQLER